MCFNPKWVDEAFTLEGKKLIAFAGRLEWKKTTETYAFRLPKVPSDNVKEVELVFDRKWFVCLSYDDGIAAKSKKEGVASSIDPGEIHTIASVTEKGDSLVVAGRYMRSIHRLRNKKLGELQD